MERFKTPKEPIFQASFRTTPKVAKTPLVEIKYNLQTKKQFQQEFDGTEDDKMLLQTIIEMETKQMGQLQQEAQKELEKIRLDLENKYKLLHILQSHSHLPQVIDLQHRIQELELAKREWEDSLEN